MAPVCMKREEPHVLSDCNYSTSSTEFTSNLPGKSQKNEIFFNNFPEMFLKFHRSYRSIMKEAQIGSQDNKNNTQPNAKDHGIFQKSQLPSSEDNKFNIRSNAKDTWFSFETNSPNDVQNNTNNKEVAKKSGKNLINGIKVLPLCEDINALKKTPGRIIECNNFSQNNYVKNAAWLSEHKCLNKEEEKKHDKEHCNNGYNKKVQRTMKDKNKEILIKGIANAENVTNSKQEDTHGKGVTKESNKLYTHLLNFNKEEKNKEVSDKRKFSIDENGIVLEEGINSDEQQVQLMHEIKPQFTANKIVDHYRELVNDREDTETESVHVSSKRLPKLYKKKLRFPTSLQGEKTSVRTKCGKTAGKDKRSHKFVRTKFKENEDEEVIYSTTLKNAKVNKKGKHIELSFPDVTVQTNRDDDGHFNYYYIISPKHMARLRKRDDSVDLSGKVTLVITAPKLWEDQDGKTYYLNASSSSCTDILSNNTLVPQYIDESQADALLKDSKVPMEMNNPKENTEYHKESIDPADVEDKHNEVRNNTHNYSTSQVFDICDGNQEDSRHNSFVSSGDLEIGNGHECLSDVSDSFTKSIRESSNVKPEEKRNREIQLNGRTLFSSSESHISEKSIIYNIIVQNERYTQDNNTTINTRRCNIDTEHKIADNGKDFSERRTAYCPEDSNDGNEEGFPSDRHNRESIPSRRGRELDSNDFINKCNSNMDSVIVQRNGELWKKVVFYVPLNSNATSNSAGSNEETIYPANEASQYVIHSGEDLDPINWNNHRQDHCLNTHKRNQTRNCDYVSSETMSKALDMIENALESEDNNDEFYANTSYTGFNDFDVPVHIIKNGFDSLSYSFSSIA